MTIVYALLWFSGISLVLGVMLAAASKVFAVKVDPKIPAITEVLPGANCGGCGFSGCAACAEAIAAGEAKAAACPVGGQAAADKIAAIMGVDAASVVRMRAMVLCSGTHENAKQKYIYEGPHDCAAAMRLGGGPKTCPSGCIGFGSCEAVCPNNAIRVENGIAAVIAERCLGCGVCVETCPKGIIKLMPYDSKVHVGCSSPDKGPLVRSYCQVGCIGCRMCTKVCETGAVTVNGSMASIAYEKCTSCGACAETCPRGIIVVEKGAPIVIHSAQAEPVPLEPSPSDIHADEPSVQPEAVQTETADSAETTTASEESVSTDVSNSKQEEDTAADIAAAEEVLKDALSPETADKTTDTASASEMKT